MAEPSTRAKWRALRSARSSTLKKCLTGIHIVRDADPSRSGSADCTGFRVDHRETGSLSVWQADRQLSGTGAVGGFKWESATAGTHHETRELPVTFPAGGSGTSNGTQPSGMAQ